MINAQSPSFRPTNIYELLFLPQGSTTTITLKQFETLSFLSLLDKRGGEYLFNILLQAESIMEDEKARNLVRKYGIEKTKDYLNSKLKLLASQRVKHSIFKWEAVLYKNRTYDIRATYKIEAQFENFTLYSSYRKNQE